MKNNIYTNAVMSIEDHKGNNEVFIYSESIKEAVRAAVNAEDFSKEELFDFYLNSIVTTALNMRHCYSSKRGAGKYVNVDACKDVNLLNGLIDNAKDDIGADRSRISIIKSRIRQLDFDQYFMNINDPDATVCTIGDALEMAM